MSNTLTINQYIDRINFLQDQVNKLSQIRMRVIQEEIQEKNSILEMPVSMQIELAKKRISEYYGVNIDLKSRKKEIVRARAMYYRWVRTNSILSYKSMAKTLGCKHDHSTVIHALQVHQDFYDTDKSYRSDYDIFNAVIFREIYDYKASIKI
jgi:chromosomal replication initiation ATPase DnaA